MGEQPAIFCPGRAFKPGCPILSETDEVSMSKLFHIFINLRISYSRALILLCLSAWLLVPCVGLAAIHVDGLLNEPEWKDAKIFRDFKLIDPLTLAKPSLATEARVLATKEGLAVAITCEQPATIKRTHTVTTRDAREFDSDNVTLIVDFDGTGKLAYEFDVSISGSYSDGIINDQTIFPNTDWDPAWQRAVHEEPQQWTVEILLPWSIAAMRDGDGSTRQIGLFFAREVQATKEVFGFPGISRQQSNFMTKFAKVEIPSYSSQQLDVVPHVTVLSDMVNHSTKVNSGLDISWKPNGAFQVAATFYPDFGQVESDQLVINFTAFESFFSDKRPFFTENQGIFNVSMASSGALSGGPPGSGGGPSGGNSLFYTRRVGGPRDDNGGASDIKGALKVIGSAGLLNYGIFAAKEDENVGRTFYAGRVTLPKDQWSIGWFTSYVERPFLDRTGLVNSFDYDFRFGESWRWNGQFVGSTIETQPGRSSGTAFWSSVDYIVSRDQDYSLTIDRYDNRFDIDDLGYLKRNDTEDVSVRGMWQQNGFPKDAFISDITWSINAAVGRNTEGDVFPTTVMANINSKLHGGDEVMLNLNFASSGYDDRLSRGNGLVRLNQRLGANINYSTPRRGEWKESIGVNIAQEGVDGWGYGINADAVWYPSDNLNLDLNLSPNWSRDWLIWVQGTQLGSFSRRQVSATLSANWFPAVKHELRLKTQWATVNAKAEQSYSIGDNGRLIADNTPMNDFAQVNFGLQFRYRYEIGPLSDFYLVYSRGGFDYINNPDKDTISLLTDSTTLRDSDQILAKIRYRF